MRMFDRKKITEQGNYIDKSIVRRNITWNVRLKENKGEKNEYNIRRTW